MVTIALHCSLGNCHIFPVSFVEPWTISGIQLNFEVHYTLCNTDTQQLATVIRAGFSEGRSKLLIALTLSTDAALRFHYEAAAEKGADKGSGKGKDIPSGWTDNSTSTEPAYTQPQDYTPAPSKPTMDTPLPSSSPTGSTTVPSSSPAGSTSTPATGPATSTRPKIDLVDDPTPKVPLAGATVPMSTRQLNCCRAACQHPGCHALCSYNSEIPYDSHFSQHSTTRHLCKEHCRNRLISTPQPESRDSEETWNSQWDSDWNWNQGSGNWRWRY